MRGAVHGCPSTSLTPLSFSNQESRRFVQICRAGGPSSSRRPNAPRRKEYVSGLSPGAHEYTGEPHVSQNA
jgi:hypothetical protein